MFACFCRVFSVFIAVACWLTWPVPALAVNKAAQADTRLVIDISGSMKKTDPKRLRIPASQLLVNLAKGGSKLGVWTFGKYVNMLVPHGEVNASWRDNALRQLEKINSVALYTNIGEALEKASLRQTKADPTTDRTIVLLSDGMVDISKNRRTNAEEKNRILTQVIPKLKKAGFKIHSVALSDAADQRFLKRIAQETNGKFSVANSADELLSVFVAASDQINKPEQVPLTGNRFAIDAAVEEFTALVMHKPGAKPLQLVSPAGKKITLTHKPTNVAWFSDPRYDLVTIKKPSPGEWRLDTRIDPDNRVTVITDLSLEIEGLPSNLILGEKAQMNLHFTDKGKHIKNPDFLSVLDITFSQEKHDGERFSGKLTQDRNGNIRVPEDGIYRAKLGRTLTEGEHRFEILVDGKTFQRKRTQLVTVHREVMAIKEKLSREKGEELKSLIVTPKVALVDAEQLGVAAQLISPNGKKVIQEATVNSQGQWQIDVPQFDNAGIYEVKINVSGQSIHNKAFKVVQGPYKVDYTLSGIAVDNSKDTDLDELAEEFATENLSIPDIDEPEAPTDELVAASTTDTEPDSSRPEAALVEAAPVAEAAEPAQRETIETEISVPAEQTESGDNTLLMVGLVLLANLFLIIVGWLFYRRTISKVSAEQDSVEEEITRLQKDKSVAAMSKEDVVPKQQAEEVAEENSGADAIDLDDEATIFSENSAPVSADLDLGDLEEPTIPPGNYPESDEALSDEALAADESLNQSAVDEAELIDEQAQEEVLDETVIADVLNEGETGADETVVQPIEDEAENQAAVAEVAVEIEDEGETDAIDDQPPELDEDRLDLSDFELDAEEMLETEDFSELPELEDDALGGLDEQIPEATPDSAEPENHVVKETADTEQAQGSDEKDATQQSAPQPGSEEFYDEDFSLDDTEEK